MGIGVSIFLLALGAILAFAVDVNLTGLDIPVVGIILMACGLIGLVLSVVAMNRTTRPTGPVYEERERTYRDDGPAY